MEVDALGLVPDEVLLLCGRPASAPSSWWTPSLDGRPGDEAERLVAAARDRLARLGLLDVATGRPVGLLGDVADVVADARVLLLLETERPGSGTSRLERRSVVVAPDRALFDLQDADGFHDLLLAGASSAVGLLASFLAACIEDAGAVTRVVRTATDGEPVSHAVTLVADVDGAAAHWALPHGGTRVHAVDEDGAVDLALVLLGADVHDVGAGVAA